MNLTLDQKKACEKIYKWWFSDDTNIILEGAAGTGKTYIAKYIVSCLPKCEPLFTAPTHEAVFQLQNILNSEYDCKTTYAALNFSFDTSKEIPVISQKSFPQNIYNYNLLIVDESSYIGNDLFKALEDLKIKKLYIGHRNQLPPVEIEDKILTLKKYESQVFKRNYSRILLSEVKRHSGELLTFCKQAETDIVRYTRLDTSYNVKTCLFSDIVNKEIDNIFNQETKILCWTNKLVDTINSQLRVSFYNTDMPKKFEMGDKLLIVNHPLTCLEDIEHKNKSQLFNSEKKNILPINSKLKVIFIDEYKLLNIPCYKLYCLYNQIVKPIYVPKNAEDLKAFRTKELKYIFASKNPKTKERGFQKLHFYLSLFAEVKYNYAITIHRSQGMSINTVILLKKDLSKCHNIDLRKKLFYVGVSRAKENLYIIQ